MDGNKLYSSVLQFVVAIVKVNFSTSGTEHCGQDLLRTLSRKESRQSRVMIRSM